MRNLHPVLAALQADLDAPITLVSLDDLDDMPTLEYDVQESTTYSPAEVAWFRAPLEGSL